MSDPTLEDCTIFVDADACPVKDEVYRVAGRYGLPVVLVSNSWFRTPNEPWIELVVVKETGELDVADDHIVERTGPRDIVVTEDILLAGRVLQKGGRALNPRGKIFTENNIGDATAMRELMAGLRETGEVTGGAPPFAKEDRSRFLQSLDQIIQKVRRGK
ncbi:MAG: YaiI/YqxD family protein [Gemmatimonadota bacterium]|nr:YaiI/YqxD family protein [Gemmatimonadota bacterium]MDH5758867.1 YaiI/YqxD family protein [Gemmatimonadota bacterium]